jgi:glycosyltransferase involved in cell wall biosynthesis
VRVIHVVPTPFGTSGLFGGGERYPLELARALAAEVECELITFGRVADETRAAGGLRIRQLRAARHIAGHPAHPVAPSLPPSLFRADVIHTHHMRSTPSQIAAVTGRVLGKHLVVTDHGLQGTDWCGLLPRLFERFLMVSQYSAVELNSPPERTRVIYGGADPERYCPDPRQERDGVLFVGRITPHKGVDRLIAALPVGARLTIAGSEGHDPQLPESGYPAYLRQLAAGRDVRFAGPVSDEDLPQLYRQARVLVLPSVHHTCYGREIRVAELLGLVVLEAMASGTPVICSRLGGLPEIVDHGVTGYLVEPGDIDELHHRLEELTGNVELAARLGRNARERVLASFTWQRCADRCLAAYNEMIAGKR